MFLLKKILIHLQEKFDSQRIENERLVQQLEIALADAKKQADVVNEKSHAKV